MTLRQVGGFLSSTNKTDRHDITEILLNVALNTIEQTNKVYLIPGHSKVYLVPTHGKLYLIPAHDKVYLVPVHGKVYLIPAHGKVYLVQHFVIKLHTRQVFLKRLINFQINYII